MGYYNDLSIRNADARTSDDDYYDRIDRQRSARRVARHNIGEIIAVTHAGRRYDAEILDISLYSAHVYIADLGIKINVSL